MMSSVDRAGGRIGDHARVVAQSGLVVAYASALIAGPIHAQSESRVTTSLSGELTYTNNVDLESNADRQAGFVFQLTPGVQFNYQAARARLTGTISVPLIYNARSGIDDGSVLPIANVNGNLELVKDFFFVDAEVNVQQTYLDPFGARPPGLSNATNNRYTSQSYRVTPYIQGSIGSTIRYSVRNENLWTSIDDAAISSDTIYTNTLLATIDREPLPFGWGADVERTEYDFPDQDRAQKIELARGRLVWQPDPQFRGYVSAGYERQQFALTSSSDPIYGAGFRWRPTERTSLDLGWEHRFFGPSYFLAFDHRTPRTAWSARASRNISSTPEQLARLPAGTFVPGILNDIFRARIPDPIERTRFIVDYIAQRGLPVVLNDPLAIFAQEITLQENASANVGLLGARNTVFFGVYRTKTEPVTGTGGLLPVDGRNVNNTQVGGSVAWSNQLTPTASMTLTADYSTTDADPPFSGSADQWSLRLYITRPISPHTSVFAGARYVKLDSDPQSSYNEAAVFIGASHTFR